MLVIHDFSIRMIFRVSPGIVNIKRGERFAESHGDIDKSTTKKSGRIPFAYSLEVLTAQKHQGCFETVNGSAPTKLFSGAPPTPARYIVSPPNSLSTVKQSSISATSLLKKLPNGSWC